jgi:Virulence factor BrkB
MDAAVRRHAWTLLTCRRGDRRRYGRSTALVASGFGRRKMSGARHDDRPDVDPVRTEVNAPERGWIEVLKRVYERFSEDRVMSIAGGVTFFALLAIFPAIAALVSIYGLFADPASLNGQVNQLSGVLQAARSMLSASRCDASPPKAGRRSG